MSFYVDLDKCIASITKHMKVNSYQFWVVGNRTVKKVNIPTNAIISELGAQYNLITPLFKNILVKECRKKLRLILKAKNYDEYRKHRFLERWIDGDLSRNKRIIRLFLHFLRDSLY